METNPTYSDGMAQNLQERLTALEKAFAENNRKVQKYAQERDLLIDQNFALKQENHQMQHDYERLRVQKGGFGFKMLLISGFGGFFTALLLCYIYVAFIKPKPHHEAVFGQFSRENLFSFEYELTHKHYGEVENTLKMALERPEYQAIRQEIEFTQKIVQAARRGGQ